MFIEDIERDVGDVNLGHLHACAEVVAVERDVKQTKRKLLPIKIANVIIDGAGNVYTSGLHPYQNDVVNITVWLHKLMSQAHERALQVVVRQYPNRIQWFCS